MNEQILNVTTLNNYIHNIFVTETMLHNIQVCGEISEFKVAKGHAYFTLKDSNAQISCTCFNVAKTYVPKVGESVLLIGTVDFYEKGGRLNFISQSIKPLGNGYLALLFEQLKEKLLEAGYFDESKKKAIPKYCKKACIITSANGAAVKDIITTVKKRNSYLDLTIRDVRVQGDSCSKEVIEALKEVDKLGFDVIVIARGGGSIEDLNGFNSEQLVYAIYDAKTPIISAVGHETDFTLCDFVSDLRCPTPTAAGQAIAFEQTKLMDFLNNCRNSLYSKLENNAAINKNKVLLLKTKLDNIIDQKIMKSKNYVKNLYVQMNSQYCQMLNNKILILKDLISKIQEGNLENMLNKGFWQVYNDKKILKDVSKINVGDTIELKSIKGNIKAEVTEVRK